MSWMILFHNITASISSFISGLDLAVWLSYFKDVMIFISIIFGILFVILIFKLRSLIKSRVEEIETELKSPAEAVTTYDIRWDEIKKHVQSFNEAEWKMAVIEGDKFTDDALKAGGYAGESMGERLMLIEPGQLLSLQNLWDAHKLRNLLVHDANYQLDHRQAVMAIEAFEQALRELGALS
jgi:hypothetical protein